MREKMDDFEEKLKQMTKPEIEDLKHEELIKDAIARAKDKSTVSWWWLSVPLYIIAALLMKTLFVPHATLSSGLHDIEGRSGLLSSVLFLVVPAVFALVNLSTVLNLYREAGKPGIVGFARAVWSSLVAFGLALIIIIIYLI